MKIDGAGRTPPGQSVARSAVVTAGQEVVLIQGALLVVAGAYVAWYGWFELRVLAGSTTNDAVVEAALRVQERVTRFVADAGAGAILVVLLAATCLIVPSLRWGRRTPPGSADEPVSSGYEQPPVRR